MIIRHFICFMGRNIDYTIDFKVDGENDFFTISDNTSIISVQADLISNEHIENLENFILDLNEIEEENQVEAGEKTNNKLKYCK